jgi:hypothetical protein
VIISVSFGMVAFAFAGRPPGDRLERAAEELSGLTVPARWDDPPK